GTAGDEHGQLPAELDLLLEQDRVCLARLREPVTDLTGGGDDSHALAVVAAARGLRHDRPPIRAANAVTSAALEAEDHRGHGMPSSRSRTRIASLSCAYRSALGPGCI